MTGFRALFRDRMAGGVSAGLFGWLLVVNLFVAAFSCGMTVPAGAGPLLVMCEPGQSLPLAGEGEPRVLAHDCPYVIGHDGDALLVAALAPGADLGPAFQPATTLDFRRAAATVAARPIDPGRLGLAPSPRGPPIRTP